MNTRQQPYDRLCQPHELMIAFEQIRATVADQALVAEYAAHLAYNLRDLATRLAGRCYRPPAALNGGPQTVGASHGARMRRLEDLIAQQSARNALGAVFAPEFLDCSFGYCPERDAEMAVTRVLAHRAGGDIYAVVAGVDFGFSQFDHDLTLRALAARIDDARMIDLIGAWLDGGLLRASSSSERDGTPAARQLAGGIAPPAALAAPGWPAPAALKSAIARLLEADDERGFDEHPALPAWLPELLSGLGVEFEDGFAAQDGGDERLKLVLMETAKRFGRDAALVGTVSALISLSSGRSPRELLKPKPLALAAAAVLVANLYPRVAQSLRGQPGTSGTGVHPPPASPLAPMLTGIALHHFDLAMARAGLHYVRHYVDFAVTTHNEGLARQLHAAALRRLRELRLMPHQPPVPVKRFDQGVEFCGYRFHDHLIAAAPLAPPERTEAERAVLIEALRRSLELMKKSAPLGARVKEHVSNGVNRLGALLGQRRR